MVAFFFIFWPYFGSFRQCSRISLLFRFLFQFYMFLESLFRSFAFMYSISSAESSGIAPWSEYMLSSLYSILLWFFFLNFLVNMQLTEFDCRTAREIAGGLGEQHNPPPAEHQWTENCIISLCHNHRHRTSHRGVRLRCGQRGWLPDPKSMADRCYLIMATASQPLTKIQHYERCLWFCTRVIVSFHELFEFIHKSNSIFSNRSLFATFSTSV